MEGCPAQPELDPSAIRTVVVSCESLASWNPNNPALLAKRWRGETVRIRPAATSFCFRAASMMVFTCGIICGARALAVAASKSLTAGYCCGPAAGMRSGFGGAITASSSAFRTACFNEASSRSSTILSAGRPARVTAIEWRRFREAVVIPLLANLVYASRWRRRRPGIPGSREPDLFSAILRFILGKHARPLSR